MAPAAKRASYRFTFGPWNISTGRDPFGPAVRKEVAFAAKVREYRKLGFDGVQFHDDDVVEADLDPAATLRGAAKVRNMLEGEGLFCEFVAPRLWEHPKTIDGGFTSNSAAERRYAVERAKRSIDIANALDCHDLVLWLAREGTYIREAKDPIASIGRIVEAINALLDVKAMRTTRAADQTKHLANSRAMFLRLVDLARGVDAEKVERFRAERDYEGLEMYILEKLMGG